MTENILIERPGAQKQAGVYITLEDCLQIGQRQLSSAPAGGKQALAQRAGAHHSRFRGRGIDFDEVRIYQPGDDVRTIDWRVTARTGKVHTKLFREERERPVYLVVDQRAGMFFGSRQAFKSVCAARLAAALAWRSSRHGDRVGGFVFNDRDVQELRPRSGKRGLQPLLRHLVYFNQQLDTHFCGNRPPQPLTLLDALNELIRIVRAGSQIFIISDFEPIGSGLTPVLQKLSMHNDVTAVQISDPLEEELMVSGYFGVTDGRRREHIFSDARLQQDFREGRRLDQEHLQRACLDSQVRLVQLSTSDSLPQHLTHLHAGAQLRRAQGRSRP